MTTIPITADAFHLLAEEIERLGFADVAWAEGLAPPRNAEDFAAETIFVICNSGMRNTVARRIYHRVMAALAEGRSARTAFGHAGKAAAIDVIWRDRAALFAAYTAADDKLAACQALPWIGWITRYHLAKNFGADVAKPDVHLQRLATLQGTTVDRLCGVLAVETGYRIATIDTVLWRCCAEGVIDSRQGLTETGLARLKARAEARATAS